MNSALSVPVFLPGAARISPPLSLYVHLPWCARKCPYCDFNSHKAPAEIPETEYVRALLTDAETIPPLVWGRRVSSVFIGGGTPSLFSPEAADRLLQGLRALSLLPPDCEITLEANPGSSDEAKFAEFAAAGINRLSLGVQSFNDQSLSALGRVHDGAEAKRAMQAAARAFDNFNIDLMHALPGQSVREAKEDLAAAMETSVPHLSLYQLTLEPNTPFFQTPPPNMPDDDQAADISDAVCQAAQAGGYGRYEISAFAKPGRECAHNLNYWRFGDYAGIGAGAHGKITGNGIITRYARIKHPGEYMRRALSGNAVSETRTVGGGNAVFEFMMNALRLPEGFSPAMLQERTGATVNDIEDTLSRCEKDGLLFRNASVVKPTPLGLRYLNDMLTRFLPTADHT